MTRVYLDWNATAPLRPEARAATVAALEAIGNPSSIHAEGRVARRLIEQARAEVAGLVGAEPRNVLFTSGGTEANVLALSPATGAGAAGRPCGHLLVSAIEHPSVLAGGRFPPASVEQVAVTAAGAIDLVALEHRLAALAGKGIRRPLVSLMLANNETGSVQPVSQAARITHAAGGLLHVDAVQAAGKIPCNIDILGADLLTLSGHKIGAPKGVGALVKRDEAVNLELLVKGGGQERGVRAGTENVAAIAGFGAAAVAARSGLERVRVSTSALRDKLEARLRAISPDVLIFGAEAERLPNTALFTVAGLRAETAVIALDLEGVAVSSGSACSSGKVTPSHVLAAMGVSPPLARGAVRVSLGPTTSESEVERFLEAWTKLFQSLTNGSDIAA